MSPIPSRPVDTTGARDRRVTLYMNPVQSSRWRWGQTGSSMDDFAKFFQKHIDGGLDSSSWIGLAKGPRSFPQVL